jgi:NAD-dependent SIR2 family protein deacetylase
MDYLEIDTKKVTDIKYNNFLELLKNGKLKNISFMTGAGISTSAGIPDFRSPGGLFTQMQEKYKLSSPEEFFHIQTFRDKPEYFYEFAREFNVEQYNPTPSHVIFIITYFFSISKVSCATKICLI